jgi:hypothetical protein
MANTFAPFGFRSFGDQEGAAPTMGLTRYYLASSDTNLYFTGDVVAISTGALAPIGYVTLPASGVTIGSTSNAGVPILGIFAGCEYYSPSVARTVWSSYFPGNVGSSAPGNAYVITNPNAMFLVQSTTTAVLGTTTIGFNIGFTSSETVAPQKSGNLFSGISNVALLSSTVGGGAGLAFKIIDTSSNYMPPGVNGADGTTAGSVMVVGFNNEIRRALIGPST